MSRIPIQLTPSGQKSSDKDLSFKLVKTVKAGEVLAAPVLQPSACQNFGTISVVALHAVNDTDTPSLTVIDSITFRYPSISALNGAIQWLSNSLPVLDVGLEYSDYYTVLVSVAPKVCDQLSGIVEVDPPSVSTVEFLPDLMLYPGTESFVTQIGPLAYSISVWNIEGPTDVLLQVRITDSTGVGTTDLFGIHLESA